MTQSGESGSTPSHGLLQVATGRRERPEMERGMAQLLVRLHEPRRILPPLGMGEKLLGERTGRLQLRPLEINSPRSSERCA